MKAAVFYTPGDIRIEELEKPEPGPDEVVIRVKACGICGSDVHLFEGKWSVDSAQVIMGHELSGIVEAIGEKVADIEIGESVVVDPNIICGQCVYCRMDTKNYYCINRKVIGWEGWLNGGFAELVKAPEKVVYRLPKDVSFEEAVMVEPIACALRAIDNVNIKCGDRVVILGAGAMGMILLQLVKLAGASWVCVIDIQDHRLTLAKKFGADRIINAKEHNTERVIHENTGGIGVDVAIEAVGGSHTFVQALGLIRRGGKVCVFGVAPQEEDACIRPFDLYYKEAVIVSSFCNPFTFQRAIELLKNKNIDVLSLISHRYSLEDIERAFKTMIEDEKRSKVIIELNASR